jgi:hypothetical protein
LFQLLDTPDQVLDQFIALPQLFLELFDRLFSRLGERRHRDH